jgi:hypothetical protein
MNVEKNQNRASMKTDVILKNISLDTIKKKEIREIGGPSGLEPTRFGDWEKNGRCSDF